MVNVNAEIYEQWELSRYRMESKEPEMKFLPSVDCTQRWGGKRITLQMMVSNVRYHC